ncbi:MAG: helicase HerA-like domain-containing protein [Myxococcota bacterium]
MKLHLGQSVRTDTFAGVAPFSLDGDALVRHAVCVGMTGSGKTGLCVALLEEVASSGVPVLVIDPKGDLANLALAFREHAPADFAAWAGPKDDPAALSQRWRSGLAESGVGPERVAAFVDRVAVRVYTPGSAVAPVDVLGALARPEADLDDEGLAELVGSVVGGLLGLVGAGGDPLTDPATLVLGRVVEEAWRAGEPVTLEALVTRLVDPPFAKVGVFPVDTFFPRGERMQLAMKLNALASSPAFAPWATGTPLDVDALLAPEGGRTAVRVFSMAHLDEERRAFFVTQLLGRVVAWSRRQPGSTALRALVYFDEVWGYLPPAPRNPPAKKPALTLLKQARAAGVGVVLVTQNPVDVDYAALANAGTWMVGRLQTPQDRAKVTEGLAGAGIAVDASTLDGLLARLPPRVFVVREASSPSPEVVRSRHTISYLRGPLTRVELQRLATPVAAAPSHAPRVEEPPPAGATSSPPPAPAPARFLDPAVAFSARLAPLFAPHARAARADGRTVWEPALYARLSLSFQGGRDFVSHRAEHRLFFPIGGEPVEPDFAPGDLRDAPPPGPGWFAPLPAHADEARELKALERRIADAVQRGETERIFRHVALKLESRAGETREAFDARVLAAATDGADREIAALKEKVDREAARLEEKRARLQREGARHASAAQQQQLREVVSAGETLFGLFFGRKRVTTAVSSAVSRRQQSERAAQRAEEAAEDVAALEREIYDLEARVEQDVAAIRAKWAEVASRVEEAPVRLGPGDVRLDALEIVWVPITRAV